MIVDRRGRMCRRSGWISCLEVGKRDTFAGDVGGSKRGKMPCFEVGEGGCFSWRSRNTDALVRLEEERRHGRRVRMFEMRKEADHVRKMGILLRSRERRSS